jgi:hypothetical protein
LNSTLNTQRLPYSGRFFKPPKNKLTGRFSWPAEINSSDDLILPEEGEFQKYRLMIQRIEYASRLDKSAPEKGRVLRGVVAEILGYREPQSVRS